VHSDLTRAAGLAAVDTEDNAGLLQMWQVVRCKAERMTYEVQNACPCKAGLGSSWKQMQC
jgi:hypothetical protein